MRQFRSKTEIESRIADGFVDETQRYPVAADVDVLVVGGGPAGMGAAVGAARQGARTLLVERNGFLGGTATAVQMATWNISVDLMTGFAQELTRKLIASGGAVGGGIQVPFDPESVKRMALGYVLDNGIELLLHSSACAPLMSGSHVRGVTVENKSGRQALLAKAVVDCTGDADIAARAGAPYVMGREDDNKLRPMTVLVRLAGLDLATIVDYAKAHPDEFDQDTTFQVLDIEHGLLRIVGFYKHAEEAQRRGELDPKLNYLRFEGCQVDRGVAFLNSVRVYDVDGSNAFDLTRAEIEAREQIDQLVAFIRNHIPGCKDAYVVDTSTNIGVRETRRIVGGHVLSEADIAADRTYPDTVARIWRYQSFGLDQHSPDPGHEGGKDDRRLAGQDRQLRSFEIPYRCLLPQEVEGLVVAGRSLSTSHLADTWTRGMPCCMVTGQAAGTAAGLAAVTGVLPREVDLAALQAALQIQHVDLGQAA